MASTPSGVRPTARSVRKAAAPPPDLEAPTPIEAQGSVKFDDFRKAIRSFESQVVVTSYGKPIGTWTPWGAEVPRPKPAGLIPGQRPVDTSEEARRLRQRKIDDVLKTAFPQRGGRER